MKKIKSPTYKMPPIIPRGPTILRAAKFIKNPIPILDEHIENYGDTYTFYMGGVRKSIVTANPGFITHVLQKNHRAFEKSELQTDTLSQYIGHGLLTSKGDFWLRQRRMIQPGFHRERLKSLTELMVDETVEYFDKFSAELDGKKLEVDMYEKMYTLTFRIIAKTLFSTSLSEDKLKMLSDLISEVQAFIIKEVRQPFFKYWFKYSGLIRKHIRLAHQAFDIIGEIIDERKKSGVRHDDLLDMLLFAQYEDTGETMSRQQLIEEALILFVAGHETSANVLTWGIYLLGEHGAEKNRIRNELDLVLGSRKIITDDLKELIFTKQVIEETLRLYPPAWVTDRVSTEPGAYEDFSFPENTIFILYLWRMHRHKDFWDRPDEFIPSRFAPENKDQLPNEAYRPFGAGPRMCIGNHFAMMEMQVILAELVRRFNWNVLVPPEMAPLITLRPKDGLKVEIENV